MGRILHLQVGVRSLPIFLGVKSLSLPKEEMKYPSFFLGGIILNIRCHANTLGFSPNVLCRY
jgi:hypothetical protein